KCLAGEPSAALAGSEHMSHDKQVGVSPVSQMFRDVPRAAVMVAMLGAGAVLSGVSMQAQAQDFNEGGSVLRAGGIGYIVTHRSWAPYETPGGKTECPNGLNEGPREQVERLYPEDGRRRTVVEAQLARE